MDEAASLGERMAGKAENLALCLAVLDCMPDPVVLVDARRNVVGFNTAALQFLQIRRAGQNLAKSVRHPGIIEAVDALLAGGPERTIEIAIPAPVERNFSMHVSAPSAFAGVKTVSAVLVLHEMTGERKVDQVRADFVANVSHELRSPLSALVGFIETLKGPARNDAEARERFLDTMGREAGRMSRLIDDLLSLSRVEINEHVPPEGEVDLCIVLNELAELLAPQAREQSMSIVIDCPPGLPRAIGARDELTEVFQNLIDNGVKYGREGTDVRVGVRAVERFAGGPGVAVSIADESEGIPKHEIPRLTERFYRVDKARSRSLGGTGLGLAIVKHIVSRHRGRLHIESTLGAGTTVTVTLPAVSG